MFLLADAAIVGHLGTAALAGLGIAAAVLQTLVGLCVFLAYGTTASVARLLGAGDRRAALAQGIDGVWLAVGHRRAGHPGGGGDHWPARPPAGRRAGGGRAGDDVPADRLPRRHAAARHAGHDRHPARPPGHPHPAGRRGRPATPSTSCSTCCSSTASRSGGPASTASASPARPSARCSPSWPARPRCWSSSSAAPGARAPRLRPDLPGIRRAAQASVALVIRTLTLRAALLLTTYAVVLGADASSGDDQSVSVATHQLAFTIWTLPGLRARRDRHRRAGHHRALPRRRRPRRHARRHAADGLVGSRQRRRHRRRPRGGQPVPRPAVHRRPRACRTCSCRSCSSPRPASRSPGVVFVLDGVLIGAGDGTYLAWAGLAVLAVYAPVVLLVGGLGGGVVAVWVDALRRCSWGRASWC